MKNKRIEYIDFARGYAILTIVIYHLFLLYPLDGIWAKANAFGGSGVHLFFMISGFGLGFTQKLNLKSFWNKRFQRVYFPFFLLLTFSILINALLPIFNDGIQAYFFSILVIPYFIGKYIYSFGGHLWFISTIFQFYLIFPILLWIRNLFGIERLLLGCFLLSVGFWFLLLSTGNFEDRFLNSFFVQYLWEFVLGMFLADRYKRSNFEFWSAKWYVYLLIAMVAGGLFLFISLRLDGAARVFNDIPILFAYTSASILVYMVLKNLLPIVYRFMLHFGAISYSVYLAHMLLILLYLEVLKIGDISLNPLWMLGSLPFIYLGALGFDKIEKRTLNILKNWITSPKPTSETIKT